MHLRLILKFLFWSQETQQCLQLLSIIYCNVSFFFSVDDHFGLLFCDAVSSVEW